MIVNNIKFIYLVIEVLIAFDQQTLLFFVFYYTIDTDDNLLPTMWNPHNQWYNRTAKKIVGQLDIII